MYVGGFSMGGCLLLACLLCLPALPCLWINLWITFDKVLEGGLWFGQGVHS